jgi:2-polyprenyl-3-methyl-5-hydroxy-6-metoxy-1,4-benzoquinol methylase
MTSTHTNFDQAGLDKFGELAHRWWGEAARWRESGGLSHAAERTAMEGRAGVQHHGRFEAAFRCA